MIELSTKEIFENINVEYKALREETLFRLKAQQDLINYSLVVAGLLAPLISLSSTINIRIILGSFLIGLLICIFLQVIYYKHHIFIQLMSQYVTSDIVINLQKIMDFNKETSINGYKNLKINYRDLFGWDKFLTKSLYEKKTTNIFTFIFGFAESSIPTLVGCLYLFAFYSMKFGPIKDLNNLEIVLYNFLFNIVLMILFSVLLMGLVIRISSSTERRKNL